MISQLTIPRQTQIVDSARERALLPILIADGITSLPASANQLSNPIRRQESLSGRFLSACELHASRPSVITSRSVVDYRTLQCSAERVAVGLRSLPDHSPGMRVLVQLRNSAESVAALFGVWLADGVAVPIPVDMERDRIRDIVARTSPQALLTEKTSLRNWPEIVGEVDTESCTNFALEGISPRATRGEHDPAAILFTSGSTGSPKGVVLSHRNLLSNAASIRDYLEITEHDRALAVLPFYHAFGHSVLQSHILAGAALILEGSATFPETILDAIEQHGATSFSAVPELFHTLLRRSSLPRRRLPSLRYMASAGGSLAPDAARELAHAITPARLFVMYGQTEATARLSYLPPDELERRPGSIGRGLRDVELRVVDELKHPVAPGVLGMIQARGPNVMLGYWNDPDATREILRDGWLTTGDLGTVDEDGYVYPRGRNNELMKISGFRVHPREIEDVVRARVPLEQVVVLPFSTPDTGTRLALFALHAQAGPRATVEAIRQVCRRELPHYKIPAYIELFDEFPTNTAMKLDRAGLVQRAIHHLQTKSAASVDATTPCPIGDATP